MEISNVHSDDHDPDSRYGEDLNEEQAAKDPLDSDESKKRLDKIYDWWQEVRVANSDNRLEQAIDDDFVDGMQWFEEDAQLLRERHQEPLVFNEIKPTVEWVVGTEKRTRIDWKVLPRKEEDISDSEVKTKLLKYVSDVNKAQFARSRAFQSAVSNGVGWLEVGIRSDNEDEPLFVRQESWRNMWLDHMSVEPDITDARYIFRSKIIDLDIALTMFPDRATAIKASSDSLDRLEHQAEEDFYDSQLYYNSSEGASVRVDDALNSTHNSRDVVRLVECWYRMPEQVKVCRCSDSEMNGMEVDDQNETMKNGIEDGVISLYDAIRMKVRCAVFVEGNSNILLQDMPTPYNHNRFPFVPVWGYRRQRDNQPYGVTRNARDPQKDLNKRRSKALFLLSVNRTIMDVGAVEDLDQYEEEIARPDAIIEKKKGFDLKIETNIQLAEEHIMLAREDATHIRQSSGVTGENLGHETNAISGKAITARQNQGTVVTASLFDNMRLTHQAMGEIMLSLIEQFYADEKVVRITGARGIDEFLSVNGYDEETGEYLNDMTKSKADFVVAEQDYRESMREAMFEQMMEMMGKLPPETALNLLDLAFEFSDLPDKEEIVKRVQKMNGQTTSNDKEAEAKQQMMEQQQAEEAQRQKELLTREANARILSLEAEASLDDSKSKEALMDARMKAMEVAIASMGSPSAALMAEELTEEL